MVSVVPCEPSPLGHPVSAKDELIQIGCYMYFMPYVPFAHRERDGCNAFNEHVLIVGRFDGLELGRSYLPMVLFRESAPSDCHITTGNDERWYRSSAVLKEDAYGTGVLANRTDSATIDLSLFSIGELRADPEPVSGISASPTGAFSRRNKLRWSRSSRSIGCPWNSGISGGRGRCGAVRLSQMSFKLSDSLDQRRCLSFFAALRAISEARQLDS